MNRFLAGVPKQGTIFPLVPGKAEQIKLLYIDFQKIREKRVSHSFKNKRLVATKFKTYLKNM
jgi:hypothetical protein